VRNIIIGLVHLIVTVVRLAKPGGLRTVIADSILIRHQLLILDRGRKRAPNLRATDRFIAGVCTPFIRRARLFRSALILKPLHPPGADQAKVSAAVFAQARTAFRPQGPDQRADRYGGGDETAQSQLGVSENPSAD
jgi:hypothetical protein